MATPVHSPTLEHLRARLAASHADLAAAWLARLGEILDVDVRDVFPSNRLLDHIPTLIREIANYLAAPADGEIAANTAVMAKAEELGLLRFDQRASVHQLLREYQLFSEILEEFFARETAALGSRADAAAAVIGLGRAQQAVRVLQQKTVDAFITRYTTMIERQTSELRNFSRLLGHEIRQPLGVLQVVGRVLAERDGDVEQRRLADTLERNVVRLGEVAGMLERLARLTRQAEAAPNQQSVDVTMMAADVARQLGDMAASRGVRIEVAAGLPVLCVDAGRLELVVVNLLANAIKYSDPTKAERLVRILPDEAVAFRIHVTDNGLGIPPAKLDRIFDEFVRAHAGLDSELGIDGLGLGLSIVRESMDAMGGAVRVVSAEGEGTTFTLEWPPGAVQGLPISPPASR